MGYWASSRVARMASTHARTRSASRSAQIIQLGRARLERGRRPPAMQAVTCAPGRLSAVCSRAPICSPAAAREITDRDRQQRPPTGSAAAEASRLQIDQSRGQTAMPAVAEL